MDDVNPNGGGISLGHPLGATGARITATLINEFERRDARYGIATMCIGFGQAIAAVVETLSRSPISRWSSRSTIASRSTRGPRRARGRPSEVPSDLGSRSSRSACSTARATSHQAIDEEGRQREEYPEADLSGRRTGQGGPHRRSRSRRARPSRWPSGGSTWAASRCICSSRTPSSRACTRSTGRRGSARRSLSASPGFARSPRSGTSRPSST